MTLRRLSPRLFIAFCLLCPVAHTSELHAQEPLHGRWAAVLADGSFAMGLFNRSAAAISSPISAADLQMSQGSHATDVWSGKILEFGAGTIVTVPAHGVLLLRSVPAMRAFSPDGEAEPSSDQEIDKRMVYDVVSLKPNRIGPGHLDIESNVDVYQAKNTTIKLLIQSAFGLFLPQQIVGLPAWATEIAYDVLAKISAEDLAKMQMLTPPQRNLQRQILMQAMLIDRFHLQYHHGEVALPAYLTKQLGLKLERTRGPLDSIVIDRLDAPIPD